MKLIIMLLIATISCSCFAETKTKNIQVSATILPYCRIIVENGTAKNICYGYEKTNIIPSTITKENNTITIYY